MTINQLGSSSSLLHDLALSLLHSISVQDLRLKTGQDLLLKTKHRSSTRFLALVHCKRLPSMISFTEDSELMTNLLPANPVPAGNRFVAIRDADSNPALVSLSQDNKLNLIIKRVGAPKLVDLGSLYGLTTKVLAFDVYQDPELNLWFAIATDAGNNQCNFYLIVNVAAKDVLTPPSGSIVGSEAKYPLIHAIFIVRLSRLRLMM